MRSPDSIGIGIIPFLKVNPVQLAESLNAPARGDRGHRNWLREGYGSMATQKRAGVVERVCRMPSSQSVTSSPRNRYLAIASGGPTQPNPRRRKSTDGHVGVRPVTQGPSSLMKAKKLVVLAGLAISGAPQIRSIYWSPLDQQIKGGGISRQVKFAVVNFAVRNFAEPHGFGVVPPRPLLSDPRGGGGG